MKKNQATLRLVSINGKFIDAKSRNSRSAAFTNRVTRPMHRKQIISADVLPFLLQGNDYRSPSVLRNAATLLPFSDSPKVLADHVGKFRDGIEVTENIFNGLHASVISLDYSSSQWGTTHPSPESTFKQKIPPMGRGTSPTKFKAEFCDRLRAARIVAGLSQADFAKQLGLSANTYSKYEKRTLLPHHLIPVACEILDVDSDLLFMGIKRQHKAA